MKALHIRNVDELVLERLRARAAAHHRSLQGELRAILEEASMLAPDAGPDSELDLVTVPGVGTGSWSRDEIYDDDAR